MPRKSSRRKYRNYDEATLQKAIAAVKNKELTQRQASRKFDIPYVTLYNKLRGKSAPTRAVVGRSCIELREEAELKNWLVDMMNKGFSFSNTEIGNIVKKMIERSGEKSNFTDSDNRPSHEWYCGFRRRHPELDETRPSYTSDATERLLSTTMHNLNINHASQVYNCAEMKFQYLVDLYHFASQPSIPMHEISSVMLCICADGDALKPYFTRRGNCINSILESRMMKWLVHVTSAGLFTHEAFETWLNLVFIPSVTRKAPEKPILLLVDNSDIHKQYHLKGLFEKHNITLFCYPPAQSSVVAPIQSGLIDQLKTLCLFENRKFVDEGSNFSISRAFKSAYPLSLCAEHIKESFSKCGLGFALDLSVAVAELAASDSNTNGEIVNHCDTENQIIDSHEVAAVGNETQMEEMQGNVSTTVFESEEQGQKSRTQILLQFIETFVLTEEQKRVFRLKLETDNSKMLSDDHMYDVWKVLSKNK